MASPKEQDAMYVQVVLAAAYSLTPGSSLTPERMLRPTRRPVAELPPARAPIYATAATPPTPAAQGTNIWAERLGKASTIASVLCAIDCTVLPILIAVLPLASFGGSAAASAWLHSASHTCAIWFVTPVGGAALTTNLLQHKQVPVALWGLSGLLLIVLANLHLHVLPHAVESFVHTFHSAINIFGCALLLSSQRYSHQILHRMGKCCGHDH